MVLARVLESGVARPPWETAPYGVVSLLDMLEFSASEYVEISHQFALALASASKSDLPPENCTSVNESSLGYKSPRRTGDEAEPIHGGADYWSVEGSGSGDESGGDLPDAWDLRADLLPVEGAVRRAGDE